jgi:predicted aspartyl protease
VNLFEELPGRYADLVITNLLLIIILAGTAPVSTQAETASISFNMIRGSLVVIPVLLNGKGPFKFLLDTGATNSVLLRRTAEKLNIPSGTHRGLITAGGLVPVELRPVDVVQIGTIRISKVVLAVTDSDLLQNLQVDGLIGADYLKQFTISIDYKRKLLRITD